jgi:hypothetical protein
LYEDELKERIKERLDGEDPIYVDFSDYLNPSGLEGLELSMEGGFLGSLFENDYGEKEEEEELGGPLAVIYAVGGIDMGMAMISPLVPRRCQKRCGKRGLHRMLRPWFCVLAVLEGRHWPATSSGVKQNF